MIMECVWWDLVAGDPNIEKLRTQLKYTDITIWRQIDALQAKYWIMNESPPRWGAIMLWRDKKPEHSELPVNIAAETIGRPPDIRLSFTVEASCMNESMIKSWGALPLGEICTTTTS